MMCTVCIAPSEHGAPVWCSIVFPNPTHLPSPAALSVAMIDGEHNTVRPDPGTANDARPPIMFLCLARSRRRSSSSSVHASSNDRIPCQRPSAARSQARRR
ncbi:hypothetical protein ACLOJK_018952 [Asimina triloba]